ncbi:interleukin-25 [Alligator mississippiensis]|uniref:Interleukin-25 n=1 Tax=Alligator mississippiensis TaxID=8496 RepID=A0A151NQ17_ALLMI|nr:interleukin-25 [Alligator mississippiensis]KYO38932.1 interleukin-25 [Alligator mississippiensis]
MKLAAILMLQAVAVAMAQHCLSPSHCCGQAEVDGAGAQLSYGQPRAPQPGSCNVSTTPGPGLRLPGPCHANPNGPLNARAIAPWDFWEDCDPARFPQRLLQARCRCRHCVSLRKPQSQDLGGNSMPVNVNLTVYYRQPCPGRTGAFYLEPRPYQVVVACVCLLAR